MKVIAVIPAYNEAQSIREVIVDTLQFVDIVVVSNDGSSDETAAVAKAAGAMVVSHVLNAGSGAATMTGIAYARKLQADVIITLDADGQHDPADIPALLAGIEAGHDVAFANRFGQRNTIPLKRRFYNAVGNIVTFTATGLWVPDSQCGFKAFGPKAVEELTLQLSGFEFCSEIIRETVAHKWKVIHVPAKVIYTEYSMAKGQNFFSGVRTALKILLRTLFR
jgi:glycosyltransferase involved in cell wall biosynthesis